MLRHLSPIVHPDVLVGLGAPDDAAVYKLDADTAIVATLDFITPVVDDPFSFGAVAATNSLSDVYAMGGRVLFALNVVGFPRDRLPLDTLSLILAGGAAKVAEAGVPIIGGHSIDDPEPKYGLVVIGLVHPDRVIANATARPGDRLFLTKPIGSGILTTAIKRDLANPEQADEAVRVMTTLNKAGAEAMIAVGVSAATDITGFGLLGHLAEMVTGSDVAARISASAVPLIAGARALAEVGSIPGGSRRNLESVGDLVDFGSDVSEIDRLILADAQTSGGLLISVPADRAAALRSELERAGTLVAAEIGEIVAAPVSKIEVTR